MKVYRFSGIYSAFNFRLAYGDIIIKIQNTNIWCDGNLKFLWHIMKTLVTFMRQYQALTFDAWLTWNINTVQSCTVSNMYFTYQLIWATGRLLELNYNSELFSLYYLYFYVSKITLWSVNFYISQILFQDSSTVQAV
jgi:hypothetical protein